MEDLNAGSMLATTIRSRKKEHLLEGFKVTKVGELYMNALEMSPMRTTLEELDHSQLSTSIQTDNSIADGIMNKTIKQRQSKAMDKRFYWLQDRVKQREFRVFWAQERQSRRLLHKVPLTSHTQKTKTRIHIHRRSESHYLARVC